MTEVSVKRFLMLATIVLIALSAIACTRDKPIEPAPTISAQNVTPVVTLPATSPTVPVTLVPIPTETPGATATLVVVMPPTPPTAMPAPGTPPALSTPSALPPTTPSTSAPGTYTVQWGDWINKIAGQFGITARELIAANPGINPNMIYPGQVLKIPAPGGSVAPSPIPGPGTTPPSEATTYTVQRGEWMYSIARKFGLSVAQLQAANPGVNPNYLYPGQVLNIPGSGTPGNVPPAPGATPTTPPAGGANTYTVQTGDTLFSIAVRFRTTTYALQIANHLPNPNAIYPGMVLIIPPQ